MIRFVVLAFSISWIGVAPLVLSAWGVLPPLPSWLHGLGALGPVLAAYLSPREHGVYASRDPAQLSRAAVALALVVPLALASLALLLPLVRSEPVVAPLAEAFADGGWLVGLLTGSVLYGLGEEPGWRGWLQPRLQQRHSEFGATLILTPIWAAWHAPFFVYRYDFPGLGTGLGFFIGLLAGAFWLAYLFNRTGSVWVVATWHALWNGVNLALAQVSTGAVVLLNALMMVLGFTVGGFLAVQARRGRPTP